MLLRELKEGQRFMFEDRKTPLALAVARGQHPATGTFRYEKIGEHSRPILWHEETGKQLIAIHTTYFRSVLIIF